MGTIEQYRQILRRLVQEYASCIPANGAIDTETIIDSERDHYEVMHIGWDGTRRVHGPSIHLDIIDEKIWIQYDGTSRPVADKLLEAGIPKDAIVLGFHPADERQHTGFAVG